MINKQNIEHIVNNLTLKNCQYTSLIIDINYSLGGYSYFSGNYNQRGYRLSLSPCNISGRTRESTMLSGNEWTQGFYILLEQATRFNKNKLAELSEKIEPLTTAIADAFAEQDGGKIHDILKDIVIIPRLEQPKPEPEQPKNKLLTKALLERFKKIGKQEDNPIIIAKFFNAFGAGTWYTTEYNPQTRLFYGYVSIFGDHNDEWGTFSLDELESNRKIERDRHFTEKPVSDVIK